MASKTNRYGSPVKAGVHSPLHSPKQAASKPKVKPKFVKQNSEETMKIFEAAVRFWEGKSRHSLTPSDVSVLKEMLGDLQKRMKVASGLMDDVSKLHNELDSGMKPQEEREAWIEEKLQGVLPLLEEARHAVGSISSDLLRELRSYPSPPEAVKTVIQAVFLMIGEEKTNAEDWDFVTVGMCSVDFIPKVCQFDPLKITAEAKKLINDLEKKEVFTFEKANRASKAAGPLCLWVKAMMKYARLVTPETAPLVGELKELKEALAPLKSRRAELHKAIEKLQGDLEQLDNCKEIIIYGPEGKPPDMEDHDSLAETLMAPEPEPEPEAEVAVRKANYIRTGGKVLGVLAVAAVGAYFVAPTLGVKVDKKKCSVM